MSDNGWIGVDLDGTLARYDKWVSPSHIGEPIPAMVDRVKKWLSEGKQVKIFTARVFPLNTVFQDLPSYAHRTKEALEAWYAIDAWVKEQFGQSLQITCMKDYHGYEFWDDRAVQVIPNTGTPLYETQLGAILTGNKPYDRE